MRALPIAVALVVVSVVGCRSPSSGSEGMAAPSAAAPAPSASAAPDETWRPAWEAFRAAADKTAQDRRAAYLALTDALARRTGGVAGLPLPNLRSAELRPIVDRVVSLEREQASGDGALPSVPDKPEHDPPKYTGAFPIGGAVRKCYADGVLLQSQGKFYFVKDAICPDAPLLSGYVEETGDTVAADVGREGREAIVVKIADRESAADDRTDHRKAVAEYEKEYREKTAEYRKALAERQATERALGPAAKARATEIDKLGKQIDTALVAMLKGLDSPSAATSAPSRDTSTTSIDSLPSVGGSPPGALAKAAPVARGGDPVPAAAPAAGAGEDKKKKRQQCVQGCVAGCKDDAGCERTCVASKC